MALYESWLLAHKKKISLDYYKVSPATQAIAYITSLNSLETGGIWFLVEIMLHIF